MKWTRWIIWTQVFLAAMSLLASLSDRSLAPPALFPIAIPFAIVACYSLPILPLAVIVILLRSENTASQWLSAFTATILLAAATFFCFSPLVQ